MRSDRDGEGGEDAALSHLSLSLSDEDGQNLRRKRKRKLASPHSDN